VTTNAGGIPYMVTNGATGLLVECNDHKALASGVLRLLESPELASIVNRARAESRSTDGLRYETVAESLSRTGGW